ncbi:MAG TPA: hypothetical protein VMA09_09425 [Candidatus Binataceae bacterium]|nr:hypothetical protein [Candidatus Binataceae bacterium]
MSKRPFQIGILALAATIAALAVKLGNFNNPALAWVLIGLALILAASAIVAWLWPYRRRIYLRSPIRILPAHLASPRIYTSDVLGAEFIRLRDVFDDMEGIQHLYKLMLEQDEQAERKRTKRDPLADMFPPFRHSERDEIAARYLASQKAFWTALDEFRLIFARLS